MMKRYPRKPAAFVLLGAMLLAGLYLHRSSHSASAQDATSPAGMSLEQLEVAIAQPDAVAETWFHYGQQLQRRERFTHAVAAYRKAIELQPYHRQARLNCAVSLAKAGDGEELFTFVQSVVYADAKLGVDILDRPELQSRLGEARFQTMQKEARDQAMD